MALDPRSPLHPFRLDPRAARRDAIERLEVLGVVMAEIPVARSRPLLDRFVREFVDPSRAALLAAEIRRPGAASRVLELDTWLRPECVSHGGTIGCTRWLAVGALPAHGVAPTGARARCVRFERNAALPALAIDLATLDDSWAASWPGSFVSFETGRAVVVTLDYEEVRCDLRAARGTPYR
jgi:hypothetical protein